MDIGESIVGEIGVIIQHYRIHGGLESCAYSLIEGLNRRGIVPTVIGRLNEPGEEERMEDEIVTRFGRSLDFEFQPLWIDRFRKGSYLGRKTQDGSPYLALQLPLLHLNFIFDFTIPLPVLSPGRGYVKYWTMEGLEGLSFRSSLGDSNLVYRKRARHSNSRKPRTASLTDRLRKRAFERGYNMLLDSRFAAERVASVLGRDFPVVYPPVSLRRFWSDDIHHRRGIVTFGRFAPYKRQLEFLKVAARLADAGFEEPFIIVGGTETFPDYYAKVIEAAENLGVPDLELIPNCPFTRLIEILQSAAVYVHMMVNEPFGITTAEAIAAGCVPLVNNSGGQREVVPFRELRWNDLVELAEKLEYLCSDLEGREAWRAKCQKHIGKFDEAVFQSKLMRFLALEGVG